MKAHGFLQMIYAIFMESFRTKLLGWSQSFFVLIPMERSARAIVYQQMSNHTLIVTNKNGAISLIMLVFVMFFTFFLGVKLIVLLFL